MTFSDAIRTCFSKFFTFSGRASRPEYWFFFLFIVIWSVIAGIIDWQFFTQVSVSDSDEVKSVTANVLATGAKHRGPDRLLPASRRRVAADA